MSDGPHSRHSVLREIIVEHLFVGEALRQLWTRGIYDVEVLRSEYDAGGYDLVLVRGALIRHVQMKALRQGGRRAHFAISERLADRPAGCVVCAIVCNDLRFREFRFFGGETPEAPLPTLAGFPLARHSKGDATGRKSERRGHRRVPMSSFRSIGSLEDLLAQLIGDIGGQTE